MCSSDLLYERFVAVTGELLGRPVRTGVFGADMQVVLVLLGMGS